jgi:2-polyprenylphenol 6-hydroxylase
MLAATQGIYGLFEGHHPVKKGLRNLGLQLVNRLPSIKTRLIRQAAGWDDFSA